MSKKTFIILIILVVLTGIWLGLRFLIDKSLTEQPIACTMDAKQCSDGSYVSRVSPKCDFSPCPEEKEEMPYKKVLLYYYNSEKDKDESGNIKCSQDGLVVIEREIPTSKTPIQDVINLFLKGKENLTEEDIQKGITTEYPLEGFNLDEINFKEDGTLILKFNDSLNKTSGGSCRVGILWFQIEATAKQFSGVQQVRFLPEEIFQP